MTHPRTDKLAEACQALLWCRQHAYCSDGAGACPWRVREGQVCLGARACEIRAAELVAAYEAERGQAVDDLAEWAIERWDAEVAHRPAENIYRRILDQTWRQVYRYASGGLELPRPEHRAAKGGDHE